MNEPVIRVSMRAVLFLCVALSVGLVGCTERVNPRVQTKLNQDAALVGELPSNPLRGRVITSWIDKKSATMSTLYGNDVAVRYARTNAAMTYPVGSVLSAVTWVQQEDPRWFGGNIPQKVKAVEFVTVTERGGFGYERYEGSPLKRVEAANFEDFDAAAKRGSYLLMQRAAVMP
jgi:hypothetical protein